MHQHSAWSWCACTADAQVRRDNLSVLHCPPTGPMAVVPSTARRDLPMLHKLVIDTLSAQASRLLMNEGGLPGPEVEKHLKALLQSALSKLDVVSRDEFDTQQAVLMRTRERLEALEKRVSELEAKTQ